MHGRFSIIGARARAAPKKSTPMLTRSFAIIGLSYGMPFPPFYFICPLLVQFLNTPLFLRVTLLFYILLKTFSYSRDSRNGSAAEWPTSLAALYKLRTTTIVISKHLKRHSQLKRREPAYSIAMKYLSTGLSLKTFFIDESYSVFSSSLTSLVASILSTIH